MFHLIKTIYLSGRGEWQLREKNNTCISFYWLPMATWSGCVQEDRNMPDMLPTEKSLPGLPARS